MQSMYISELYTIRTNIFNIIICHQRAINKNSEVWPAFPTKHENNNKYLFRDLYWKSAQQAVTNKWNCYGKMCRELY